MSEPIMVAFVVETKVGMNYACVDAKMNEQGWWLDVASVKDYRVFIPHCNILRVLHYAFAYRYKG